MRPSLILLSAFLLVLSLAPSARADYIVWKDSRTGASLSWPDTWRVVSNADGNDVVTIMAPAGRGHAACRLRANTDRRYNIYPMKYSWAVQRVAYNEDFWKKYLNEYKNAELWRVSDGAGLGRGFATYAIADFNSAIQGPEMNRRALMFATLYNGKAYVLECSSHKDAFDRWKKLFLSIAGSVDFEKGPHELPSGNYYNFMQDPRMEFEGAEGQSTELY